MAANIHELPSKPQTAPKVLRLRIIDGDYASQLLEFKNDSDPKTVFDSRIIEEGDPMSAGRAIRQVTEIASKRDIELRQEEQIERIARKIQINRRLTTAERRYLVNVSEQTIFKSGLLQNAS